MKAIFQSLERRKTIESKTKDKRKGCGSLFNAGVCGLDFHRNGKRVICWKCKKEIKCT